MDKNAEALARIIEEMSQGMSGSRKARKIAEKIASGKATYEDALDYARENSRIMTDSMKRNLPEVLTDGKLFRAEADQVIRKPMKRGGEQVAETAAKIQQQMNEAAGIGINAIVPDVNEDQITGIITDICNAESYSAGADRLFTQIENFLEGTVDDCVRENADFQYQAGLDPVVIRTAAGKCCKWCDNLAGTYKYEDVSDRGNDVWRRHRNCHCVIEFDPGQKGGKRKTVSGSRSTDPGKADRIAFAEHQGQLQLDLQMFAHKKGDYRAMMYRENWQQASLKEARRRFTPGAKPEQSPGGRKTYFISRDGKRRIEYDRSGKYFRIKDISPDAGAKSYLKLDGSPAKEIIENGVKRPTTPDEYEQMTHFLNTDKGG